MEIQEALEIVRKLADGLHPQTGETLPADCLFQHPQAVRALQHALGALETQHQRLRVRSSLPPNAGKPWTDPEDAQLTNELRQGITLQEIAKAHSRREGSIVARLLRLRQKTLAGRKRQVAS
jgi:hypothetical protein